MNLLFGAASNPEIPAFLPMFKAFLEAMLSVWPLWLLIGLLALGRLALDLRRLRRLSKSGIKEVDQMDGRSFEVFLSSLFRRLGYGVELTRYRGDYGADLVVTLAGARTAVQAKRWSKRVGIKAVQEAVAAKGYYGCDYALVVANRDFTPQARVLARANAVELWPREVLVAKLLAVGEGQVTDETPATVTDDPGEATCVACGITVSEKVRDYCLARPAHFGGLVYCFAHQRSA
jgi:restriction system protein